MNKISTSVKILFLSGLIILGTQYAIAAWSDPGCAATGCNTDVPINSGTNIQAKGGNTVLGSLLDINGTLSSQVLSVFGTGYVGGNLGVGVPAPTVKLDVSGNVKATQYNIGTSGSLLYDSNGGGTTAIRSGPSTAYKYFTFDTNGTFNALNGDVCTTLAGGVCLSTVSGGGGGGPGSGTVNKLPKWAAGGTTLTDSSILDNGSSLTISGKNTIQYSDTWLRLNQAGHYTSGVYTPNFGVFRTDAPLQVGVNTTGTFYAPIGGNINIGHDLILGTSQTTGVPGTAITFPGGNKFSSNHSFTNPSDVNYGNMFAQTERGFIVCNQACNSILMTVNNVGYVTANGFFYTSDKALKKNIQPLQDSLSKIMQLKAVSFNWKDSGKPSIGLVAQDVEKIYPELVQTDSKGLKSVQYGNLVSPLIQAIQEQQKEIDALKVEINDLKNNK